jgi:hypothetical protein
MLIDISARKSTLLFSDKNNIKEKYDKIKSIEILFKSEGCNIEHQSRKNVIQQMLKKGYQYILIPPRVTKENVFDVVSRANVFIPKSTRFVLPVRVMFMNVPIELLSDSLEMTNTVNYNSDAILAEKNKQLNEILRKKKLFKIKGNVDIDRHYDEEYLYIFDIDLIDKKYNFLKNRILEDTL